MKNRILIAKPGLDGHDRGAIVIYRALKDAGFDVLYTGIRKTPQEIVEMVLAEDVNIVGLSCLSGNHLKLFGHVIGFLKNLESDVKVIGGGIIPQEDIVLLKEMGVKEVFTPGASLKSIINKVKII